MATPKKSELEQRVRLSSRTVSIEGSAVDTKRFTQENFTVTRLPGPKVFINPMVSQAAKLATDEHRFIMFDPVAAKEHQTGAPVIDHRTNGAVSLSSFTLRAAHCFRHLHFNPQETTIGIVTCGGLCPGLNDVIRGISYLAVRQYRVKQVIGFKYGYWGLSKAARGTEIDLDPSVTRDITNMGGSVLGTSRGPQDVKEMAETLRLRNVNILICIGGDGTQKGAVKIGEECRKSGFNIAVVGVPKTIDNDLSFSHRTFGYQTAVREAVKAIRAAYAEARSHKGGIGIVKVMGRHSGFIAAKATLAAECVTICLIPEVKVSREKLMRLLQLRFKDKDYCIICVAEGFGQDWGQSSGKTDASGNKKLLEIGKEVKIVCNEFLASHPVFKVTGTTKLIDPSYMIRACPPTPDDAAFCTQLANLAVHEAMAGTTEAVVTYWYNNFVMVPIRLATSLRKEVEPDGMLWQHVLESVMRTTEESRGNQAEALQRNLRATELRAARLRTKLNLLESKL